MKPNKTKKKQATRYVKPEKVTIFTISEAFTRQRVYKRYLIAPPEIIA